MNERPGGHGQRGTPPPHGADARDARSQRRQHWPGIVEYTEYQVIRIRYLFTIRRKIRFLVVFYFPGSVSCVSVKWSDWIIQFVFIEVRVLII